MSNKEIDQATPIELLRLLNYDYEDLAPEMVLQRLMIKEALRQLSIENTLNSIIVQFHFTHDIRQEQIAEILGLNQATISRRLESGIDRLKELIE